jgi:hypothetical protein
MKVKCLNWVNIVLHWYVLRMIERVGLGKEERGGGICFRNNVSFNF